MLSLGDIQAARARIRDGIAPTPCTVSVPLSELTGCRIHTKDEYLQRTGSFKERGARNALMLLSAEQRRRGVIAASAGNHALGLAYHGGLLGIPLTVVMPVNAPLIKASTCRRLGARVVLHGESFADARTHADALARTDGLTYVHGFDSVEVIAGQGTVGLEILEEVPDADAIVVPVGGGGLLAGVATAVKALRPEVRVLGVEPEHAPSFGAALAAGAPTAVDTRPTLADGLAVSRVGDVAFALAAPRVDGVAAVDEEALALAIFRLLELEKCVVEGAAAGVLAAIADAQHGANIHGAIVDELHIHKTPDLVETIETGRGSRVQPLVVIITTADEGKPDTVYEHRRKRVEECARGTIKAAHVYGVIWAADKDDDPFAEETWRKANPGYGISPTRGYLERKATDARNDPAALAAFLRLHLGLRTKQTTRYITLEEWDRTAAIVDERKLAGRVAYAGLDLGNVADLTALCWLFPDGQGGYDVLWRFWLPEDRVPYLSKRTAGGVRRWIKEGFIEVTPGATTDYDFVIAQVQKDRKVFKVKEIGYDPWNANQLTKVLAQERAPLVEVRQGYRTMSPALKEIKRLLAASTDKAPLLRHGGNPVMRWMTDNLTVAIDPAGNVKPDKSSASDKIDGWSALVTGMSRAMHYRVRRSAYSATTEAG